MVRLGNEMSVHHINMKSINKGSARSMSACKHPKLAERSDGEMRIRDMGKLKRRKESVVEVPQEQ